jgi:CheY-like chemotaxis protein
MSRIRVLLVDDHKLFRAGIRSLLQTVGDVQVVAEASDGREALQLVETHLPDIVLLDIAMPSLNGLDAAARIASTFPRSRVIILSMNADEDSVLKTLRAGAVGYLVKTADPAELELAIRAAARGEKFLSSAVAQHRLIGSAIGALLQRMRNIKVIATGINRDGVTEAIESKSPDMLLIEDGALRRKPDLRSVISNLSRRAVHHSCQ